MAVLSLLVSVACSVIGVNETVLHLYMYLTCILNTVSVSLKMFRSKFEPKLVFFLLG